MGREGGSNHQRLIGLCNYINDLNAELFYLLHINPDKDRLIETDLRLKFVNQMLETYPLVKKYWKAWNNESLYLLEREDRYGIPEELDMMVFRIMEFEERLYRRLDLKFKPDSIDKTGRKSRPPGTKNIVVSENKKPTTINRNKKKPEELVTPTKEVKRKRGRPPHKKKVEDNNKKR